MVKIRLRRVGRKNAPLYRILVADSQSPRDGKFIEIIGQYAPRQSEGSLNVDEARANYWLDQGAQPTDTVRSLLRRAGVLKARHEQSLGSERKVVAVPVERARTKQRSSRRLRRSLHECHEPEYAIVGLIRKAQGIRGEVVIEPLTDKPDVVFASGSRVFAGTPDGDLAVVKGSDETPKLDRLPVEAVQERTHRAVRGAPGSR